MSDANIQNLVAVLS